MAVFSQRKLRKNGLFHFLIKLNRFIAFYDDDGQLCCFEKCLYVTDKKQSVF